jgi:hypothetical protein
VRLPKKYTCCPPAAFGFDALFVATLLFALFFLTPFFAVFAIPSPRTLNAEPMNPER